MKTQITPTPDNESIESFLQLQMMPPRHDLYQRYRDAVMKDNPEFDDPEYAKITDEQRTAIAKKPFKKGK